MKRHCYACPNFLPPNAHHRRRYCDDCQTTPQNRIDEFGKIEVRASPVEAKRENEVFAKARKTSGLRTSIKAQHGLGAAEFRALVAKGQCDACGSTDPGTKNGWGIDHDHLCCPGASGCKNCIRGLLCHGCNMALGAVKDDANRLLDLYAYLYRDQGMPVPQPQEALNG